MDDNKPAYKKLAEEVQRLQAKLDAIEQSNQRKSKFQLWLGKIGLGFLLGAGLKSSMQQLYAELPAKVKRDTLADVTANVIWRFTRIGLLAILVALIPTILLWQQNQKIDEQTKLFQKQNDKIDSQIQLEESSRRGNLIVMMSNIMDKVDDELKEREKQDSSRALSKQLIGRIAALSYAFRPYRFWQGNSLIDKPLSPERGQLLLALLNSDLDSLTYGNIYAKATFSNANLRGANLSNANLNNADLGNTILSNANLSNADLRGADLILAYLSNADLRGANLNGADLIYIDYTSNRVALDNIDLSRVNLNNTDLSNVSLRGVDLSNVKLSNVDLIDADLRGANLNNTDLSYADFQDTKIIEKEWLTKLKEWNVKGREQITGLYKIDTIPQKDEYGMEYYLIKPKL